MASGMTVCNYATVRNMNGKKVAHKDRIVTNLVVPQAAA